DDVSIRAPAPNHMAPTANKPRHQHTPVGAPQLTLNEIERHTEGNGTVISYQVLASGFPADKTYQLARLPLRGEPQVFNSEYHVEANGTMVSTTKPLDAERFVVGALAKGEPLQFVLSASDHSTGAIAKTIPFP